MGFRTKMNSTASQRARQKKLSGMPAGGGGGQVRGQQTVSMSVRSPLQWKENVGRVSSVADAYKEAVMYPMLLICSLRAHLFQEWRRSAGLRTCHGVLSRCDSVAYPISQAT